VLPAPELLDLRRGGVWRGEGEEKKMEKEEI
jgi:hypothetical protein